MSKPIENFFLTNFFVIWIKAIFGTPSSKLIAKTTVLRQPHCVYNDLLTASDSGFVSILHLLDLSAAFDTIDHNILLTRLENTFGVCDLAVSFFCSCLQGRTQAVTVKEVKSFLSLLTCWVPPGLRPGTSTFHFVYSASFWLRLIITLSLITRLRMVLDCTNLILLLRRLLWHGPSNPAFQT